jgi:glycine cleavage system H protein
MSVPKNLNYTKDHEWVNIEGDQCVMGITEFAQDQLGELVFVELPEIGRVFAQGETLCVVESTKAASDVYAPLSGQVIAVNTDLENEPSAINKEPYTTGWIVRFKITVDSELEALMTPETYDALIKTS